MAGLNFISSITVPGQNSSPLNSAFPQTSSGWLGGHNQAQVHSICMFPVPNSAKSSLGLD